MPATVAAIRRYPVKSMGGEALTRVELDRRGLVGDRRYAVVDADGRFASGKDSRRFRRRDHVFAYVAETDGDGTVRVQRDDHGWPAGDPALDADLTDLFGDPVRVLPEGGVPQFDAGAVSLVGTATLEWCRRELGVDARQERLRANLLLETAEPFEEEAWVGHALEVGTVRLEVVERIERCRTVDLAQDGATGVTPWLKALGATRDLCVGVYAAVVTAGYVAVGDSLRVC